MYDIYKIGKYLGLNVTKWQWFTKILLFSILQEAAVMGGEQENVPEKESVEIQVTLPLDQTMCYLLLQQICEIFVILKSLKKKKNDFFSF